MNLDFFQKNKSLLIILGLVLVILVILVILYFPKSVVDEKYCDGITIGCQSDIDSEGGCVNSLQNPRDGIYHSTFFCYCNTTEKVCEGASGNPDSIEGTSCSDQSDCPNSYNGFNKCLAENALSTEGKCSQWETPSEGCNYYMVQGKAKELCYKLG